MSPAPADVACARAQDSPASFTLQLALPPYPANAGAGSSPRYPLRATRLFEGGGYDVQVRTCAGPGAHMRRAGRQAGGRTGQGAVTGRLERHGTIGHSRSGTVPWLRTDHSPPTQLNGLRNKRRKTERARARARR